MAKNAQITCVACSPESCSPNPASPAPPGHECPISATVYTSTALPPAHSATLRWTAAADGTSVSVTSAQPAPSRHSSSPAMQSA